MTKGLIEKKIILSFGFFCCLFFIAGCGDNSQTKSKKVEFEIDKDYQRGPLTVHVRLDKSKITIAETVLLELEAAIETGYEIQLPKVDKVLENFGIVNWDNLGQRLDKNNKVVSAYRYRLEPFLSGNYEIPAFTFEFYDVNDTSKKHELTTEPIGVEVTSLLGEKRAELVIADIEDVVQMPSGSSFWWLWILAIFAGAGSVGGWLYLRSKKAKELIRIFKPAHEIAYARLQALIKDDLIGSGRIKEFYERISDILRHYIEDRFRLRAPERTTEEFLAELQFTDMLLASDKETLEEFLTHCDLVKFAKYSPTQQQVQRTFDLVKVFIEKTKSDQNKTDVTDRIKTLQTVEVGSV